MELCCAMHQSSGGGGGAQERVTLTETGEVFVLERSMCKVWSGGPRQRRLRHETLCSAVLDGGDHAGWCRRDKAWAWAWMCLEELLGSGESSRHMALRH